MEDKSELTMPHHLTPRQEEDLEDSEIVMMKEIVSEEEDAQAEAEEEEEAVAEAVGEEIAATAIVEVKEALAASGAVIEKIDMADLPVEEVVSLEMMAEEEVDRMKDPLLEDMVDLEEETTDRLVVEVTNLRGKCYDDLICGFPYPLISLCSIFAFLL